MPDQPNDEQLQQSLSVMLNPFVQQAIWITRYVAGYDPPTEARRPFLAFHQFVASEPPPQYITDWRASSHLEHWYRDHVDGIKHNCQAALAATYYHRDRLVAIETEVAAALSRIDFGDIVPQNSTIGVPGTHKLDFEYQAFIFAARRCLDYLTRGLAAYFRETFHSFRTMPRALRSKQQTSPVARRLVELHAVHAPGLAFLLSSDGEKSVRDLIAHYRHIDAGTLNITRRGFSFIGGGEAINQTVLHGQELQIADAIDARLAQTLACVGDFLVGFVEAATLEAR